MKHLEEVELILYRYHEPCDRAAIERHLDECAACRTSYAALGRVLAAVDAAPVPGRDESYGATVWQQLRPRLDAERARGFDWARWFRPQQWAPIAAMAVLLLAAFLTGRYWPRTEAPPAAEAINPEQVRERVLLVAVGEHLDRSQMILVELVNTRANNMVDITSEQKRAEDLITANRLYRQTALQAEEVGMASVLDDLERILLEIAHSPSQLSSKEFNQIRQRIEARGILFRVRVIGSQVRERAKETMPAAEPARTRT